MNKIIFKLIISSLVLFISCDDAGIIQDRNKVEFTHSGLRPLTQSQGIYEAWVAVETSAEHGDNAYRSIGRFNITPDGSITPSDAFNLSKVSNINSTEDAIITIEPPFDRPDTIDGIRLIGGAKIISGNSIIFNLNMEYNEILGSLATQIKNSSAEFMLLSLSTNDSNFYKQGFWFTKNISGSTQGLTLPQLPDTVDWYYRMWLIDTRDSLNSILYAGGFDNPFGEEDDYRFCYVSPPINLPGNDWIETGGQCPADIMDLSSGFYRIIVSLEPRTWNWVNSRPFYIYIFKGSIQPSSYGTVLSLPNISTSTIPTAIIRLYTE